MRIVDRYSICDQRVHAYRSACRPVVLDISADVIREALDKYAHELIVVEDIAVLQCTLDQLVRVLLNAEAVLAYASSRAPHFVDNVGCLIRAQQIVYDLQVRRNLLFLYATVPTCVLGAA